MPQERPNYVGPSMRAATRSEKFADMLRALYESMAEQPLGQIADVAGISDLKGMLAGFSDPSGIKSGVMPDGPANLAGIPFAAYKALGKIPHGKVFHGTSRVFDKFQDVKNEQRNLLGSMRHFSDSPDYANLYADETARLNPNKDKLSPNIIPAEIEAKNVLDLIEPNMDDLSAVVANYEPWQRSGIIRDFKKYRRDADNLKGWGVENYDPGYATKQLADRLGDPPEEVLEKIPFDAIRYPIYAPKSAGGKQTAWAAKTETPVKSAISGVDLSPTHFPSKSEKYATKPETPDLRSPEEIVIEDAFGAGKISYDEYDKALLTLKNEKWVFPAGGKAKKVPREPIKELIPKSKDDLYWELRDNKINQDEYYRKLKKYFPGEFEKEMKKGR